MTRFCQHWLIVSLWQFFFETRCVKIREYAFIHVYTRLFTHRVLAGIQEKTHIKITYIYTRIFLYAYMRVSAGTQYCIIIAYCKIKNKIL
jgi:hypothetical protein